MVYEYECKRCEKVFEKDRPMTAPIRKERCPTCKTLCARLASGGTGFVLQGGGWESDGYSSKR